MNTFAGMTSERLRQIVVRFAQPRIAVVGDFFLDKYLDVDPSLAEISLETGKTAHQVASVRHSPGAAGTVVSNLAALGAKTLYTVGFTGRDGEAFDLRNDLAALGCVTNDLIEDAQRRTPTYLKPRNKNDASLAGEHDRYDTKNRDFTPDDMQERIVQSLDQLLPQIDALIVMDQVEERDGGVITATVAAAIAERAKQYPNVIFWADSRRRIRQFRNVIIKPNQFEAADIENPAPDAKVELPILEQAMRHLRTITGAPVCTTRGADGILVSDPEITLVPGVRVAGPIDSTGAGDSVTAGVVLALAAGATLPEAALVGNLVASITVEQLATTGTARPEQLEPRLAKWQEQQKGRF
jgi:rfaE bifunctional protein kinase chain/domain